MFQEWYKTERVINSKTENQQTNSSVLELGALNVMNSKTENQQTAV